MERHDRTAVLRELTITAEVFDVALSEAKLIAYVEAIEDLEPNLIVAALLAIRRQSRFFPRPAEIRERVDQLAGRALPSPEEILAVIRRADIEVPVCRRDGTLAYVERSWEWPEDVPESTLACARRVILECGDPIRDGTRVFGWEQQAKAIAGKVVQEQQRAVGAMPELSSLQAHVGSAAGE